MTESHTSLTNARKAKKDEFYTQLADIERELKHYKKHFKGKTVLCNCDDPRISKFFHYFSHNFEELKLKKLITTCYKNRQNNLFDNKSEKSIYLEYDGKNKIQKSLKGDGDFRSEECIEILKEADVVVTNPPFSLLREYTTQLVKYQKKFIILGAQNVITYKEIFKLLKENKVWLGNSTGDMKFKIPNHYLPKNTRYWQDKDGQKWQSFGTMCWFTNLDIQKRHKDLILSQKYDESEYPKYDNYDAINVKKISDIPMDYPGVMGVPITFMHKFNPEQFEILGDSRYHDNSDATNDINYLDGKLLFRRILIKHKTK